MDHDSKGWLINNIDTGACDAVSSVVSLSLHIYGQACSLPVRILCANNAGLM